jgi:hypothetical protein
MVLYAAVDEKRPFACVIHARHHSYLILLPFTLHVYNNLDLPVCIGDSLLCLPRIPFAFLPSHDSSSLSHLTLRSLLSLPCTCGLSFNGCEVDYTAARGMLLRVYQPQSSAPLSRAHSTLTRSPLRHHFDSSPFSFIPSRFPVRSYTYL